MRDRVLRLFRADRVPVPTAVETFRSLRWTEGELLERPLDLEIGCGVGWHSIRYAEENPRRTLIAVEKTREKFGKFQARLERTRKKGIALRNLVPIHGDAIAFVAHAIEERSLERIFLLYPNPSPKNPAERWFLMPFFGHLLTKLRDDGTLTVRTNEKKYFEEAIEAAEKLWKLEIVSRRSFTSEEVPPSEARTHFEKKYLEVGETCYELILRKPAFRR